MIRQSSCGILRHDLCSFRWMDTPTTYRLSCTTISLSFPSDHTVRVWPIVVVTDKYEEETGRRHRLGCMASQYTVLHYHKGRAWCVAIASPTCCSNSITATSVATGFDEGALWLPLDPEQGGIVSAAAGPPYQVSWQCAPWKSESQRQIQFMSL